MLSLREIIREENHFTKVTQLEYLKQLHSTEWENFVRDSKSIAKNRKQLDTNIGGIRAEKSLTEPEDESDVGSSEDGSASAKTMMFHFIAWDLNNVHPSLLSVHVSGLLFELKLCIAQFLVS